MKGLVIAGLLLMLAGSAWALPPYPMDYRCIPYEYIELKDMTAVELQPKIDTYKRYYDFAIAWQRRNTGADDGASSIAHSCVRELERMERVLKIKTP